MYSYFHPVALPVAFPVNAPLPNVVVAVVTPVVNISPSGTTVIPPIETANYVSVIIDSKSLCRIVSMNSK